MLLAVIVTPSPHSVCRIAVYLVTINDYSHIKRKKHFEQNINPHSYSLLSSPLSCRFIVHSLNYPIVDLSNVNAMEVIGSESSIALRTLPLPIVIAALQALVTEDVETLCKHGLLIPRITAGAT